MEIRLDLHPGLYRVDYSLLVLTKFSLPVILSLWMANFYKENLLCDYILTY